MSVSIDTEGEPLWAREAKYWQIGLKHHTPSRCDSFRLPGSLEDFFPRLIKQVNITRSTFAGEHGCSIEALYAELGSKNVEKSQLHSITRPKHTDSI